MQTSWQIYDKDGNALCVAREIEYSGNWMGDVLVSVTIKSAVPISFNIGDYLVYRGETFTLDYEPSVVKKSSSGTYGEGFTYQGIKFRSRQEELTRCMFLDVVQYDNQEHYTSLPNFSFYAENVTDLLERVQANLDRMYVDGEGEGLWEIIVVAKDASGQKRRYSSKTDMHDASGFEVVNQNISIQSQSCWEALGLVSSTFELNFYIRDRQIVVGDYDDTFVDYINDAVDDNNLRYGKGKGLYEIESKSDDSKSVVTRLRAYGSTKNMPMRYYQKKTRVLEIDEDWANIPFYRYPYYASKITSQTIYSLASEGTTLYSLIQYCKRYGKLIEDTHYEATLGAEVTSATDSNNKLRCNMRIDVYGEILYSAGIKYSFYETDNEANWSELCALLNVNSSYFNYFGDVSITGNEVDKLWTGWPVDLKSDDFPVAFAVSNLMLPGFPEKSLHDAVAIEGYDTQTYSTERFDPYIDSGNISRYDVRERSIFFDGSNAELDEIYPSLEEVTVEEARLGGVAISQTLDASERLDEVETGDSVTDDGIFDIEGQTIPDAVIYLRDMGFNLRKYVLESTNSPKISMKDGFCGGREFEINNVEDMGDVRARWKVTLKRVSDSALNRYFPYQEEGGDVTGAYHINSGDHFVLLGIDMPDVYINIASARLLLAAKEWLADNDYSRMVYTPRMDEVLIERNRREWDAAGAVERSVYWGIKEGMLFRFTDDDLSVVGDVVIDVLRIKETGEKSPTIEVTLREEKKASSLSRLQNEIKSIRYGVSGSGGITREQLDSAIKETGETLFLSKTKDDTTMGTITAGGVVSGVVKSDNVKSTDFLTGEKGFSLTSDSGTSLLEVDNLQVRRRLVAEELEIRRVSYSAGRFVFSNAGSTITDVEPLYGTQYDVSSDGDEVVTIEEAGSSDVLNVVTRDISDGDEDVVAAWRCYFKADDGTTQTVNLWRVNDWALCQTINLTENRYYWRLVVGVGVNYVDLSASEYDTSTTNDTPEIGDIIAQYGNLSDTSRQKAIVLDPSVPSFTQYQNIVSPEESGDVVTMFTPELNVLSGRITSSSTYIGQSGEEMEIAEGLITDALTAKTITASNATIENLRLNRAKVSGFILQDEFTLTPSTYASLDDVATGIISVYSLGTTVWARNVVGESWSSNEIQITLPSVFQDEYQLQHNDDYDVVGLNFLGVDAVLQQCRELSGTTVYFYNKTDRNLRVIGMASYPRSAYQSQPDVAILPNRMAGFTLQKSYETVTDTSITGNNYNVEVFRWVLVFEDVCFAEISE